VARRDPLENSGDLIRRVYSYVAYRIGAGAEAEDITSEVFERALRYRSSYDRARGEPLPWLLGIARRCVESALAQRPPDVGDADERASVEDVEMQTLDRLTVSAAVERLDERGRELVALRYGADLTARQIGRLLDMRTNAVEVALHRTLARLRPELESSREPDSRPPHARDSRVSGAGASAQSR
jgi:RNA polymerase sigma-70 factor, ECF subfamily